MGSLLVFCWNYLMKCKIDYGGVCNCAIMCDVDWSWSFINFSVNQILHEAMNCTFFLILFQQCNVRYLLMWLLKINFITLWYFFCLQKRMFCLFYLYTLSVWVLLTYLNVVHICLVSDRTLLRTLIWEPVQSFKVKAMQVAVGCWDWLLVARPKLEYTVSHPILLCRVF